MDMGAKSTQFIGITGGSCAGKTWLAERLQKSLGKESGRLSLDDFYLDRAHLSPGRRAKLNFDHPRSIDWARFESVLGSFAAGREARVPKYDFRRHARQPEEPLLAPKPVILVEGLWLFRKAAIRKLFDVKIFMRLPRKTCQSRRLDRDALERGRTPEQAREQWLRFTWPMYERFVAPQERWADLVLRDSPDEEWVSQFAREFQKKMKTGCASL